MADMPNGELKFVADHMGHDLNIHSNIYALQTSLVERAKVAKILVAAENGHLHKLKESRHVDQVNIDDLNVAGKFIVLAYLTAEALSNIRNWKLSARPPLQSHCSCHHTP